jgi:hypothetical protein
MLRHRERLERIGIQMPSPSNDDRRARPGKEERGEGAPDLSIGPNLAKLIEQVTEGKVSRLEELLRKLNEGAEVEPRSDGVLLINRRSGELLHQLMLRLADYVKLQGRAIDRSNVGLTPNTKTVELLCAALSNLLEIVKERDRLILESATAAASHLTRATASDAKLKAAQREALTTAELLESLKQTNGNLEAELRGARELITSLTTENAELTKTLGRRDALISDKDGALERSAERLRELLAELTKLQEQLAARVAETQAVAVVSSPLAPSVPAPEPTPAIPAAVSDGDILARVEASAAMRALLRNYMSPGQRIRTARELKAEPDTQFLVLFDHDEARAAVTAWKECWYELYQKGSPFAADNNQRLAPVNTAFLQRLADDCELAEAFRGLSPIAILGTTATRSIIERVTLSNDLLDAMETKLGYDPRFLALLISAKYGFKYLVD